MKCNFYNASCIGLYVVFYNESCAGLYVKNTMRLARDCIRPSYGGRYTRRPARDGVGWASDSAHPTIPARDGTSPGKIQIKKV